LFGSQARQNKEFRAHSHPMDSMKNAPDSGRRAARNIRHALPMPADRDGFAARLRFPQLFRADPAHAACSGPRV